MINELFEGAKIGFIDRKESKLERKVRKLEQDMLNLDCRLENEKLLLEQKKSGIESEHSSVGTFVDDLKYPQGYSYSSNMSDVCSRPLSLGMGDAPDPWHVMPVQIHQNEKASTVQPTVFFTWNCTPYDFHNNSAQRSIYTLLGRWHSQENSITANEFMKQLSALLTVNSAASSETQDSVRCENSQKEQESIEKLNDNKRELFINLEKKLKKVEANCNQDYLNVIKSEAAKEFKEDNLCKGEILPLDQDEIIIDDDLIFDIFMEPSQEYKGKPTELLNITNEMDALEGYLQSFDLVDKSVPENIDSIQ